MNSTRLSHVVCALLTALALGGCSAPQPPPNLLLVVVDTLRADRLGVYGYDEETSPHIDALAASGLRIEGFRAAAPSTLTSFTSMLTGRYPNRHGVFRNGVPWPPDLQGVQHRLQEAGYQTAAFVSSYCLSARFGVNTGFDHFDEEFTTEMEDLPQNKLIRDAAETTDAVIAWLRGRGSDRPFFAMVHYFDPHFPYHPPPPYDTMFDPAYRGPMRGSMADVVQIRERLNANRGRPDDDSRNLHARYLGSIRYTDEQIGRLLANVESLGLRPDTVVIFTADHGETFWDHPDYFSHGITVWESGIAVPLIVAGPGIAGAGRVVREARSNIDLGPTLLDLAGVEPDPEFGGESMAELWTTGRAAESSGRRVIFAEATRPPWVEPESGWPNRLKARCAIRGGWKLIHWPWLKDRRALFDLRNDVAEQRNLWEGEAGAEPVAVELEDGLRRWSTTEPLIDREGELSEEERERLEALGYVD